MVFGLLHAPSRQTIAALRKGSPKQAFFAMWDRVAPTNPNVLKLGALMKKIFKKEEQRRPGRLSPGLADITTVVEREQDTPLVSQALKSDPGKRKNVNTAQEQPEIVSHSSALAKKSLLAFSEDITCLKK